MGNILGNTYHISRTPPTVNSLYAFSGRRGRKDRYRTPRYEAWLDLARSEVGRVKSIRDDAYELHIHISKKARGDLDGYAKAVIDFLVKAKATPDDSKLVRLLMTKQAESGVIIEVIQGST